MRWFTGITSHQPTIPPSTYPTPNPTLTHSPNHPPQLYPCTQPPPHSPTHLAVASAVSAAGVGDSSVEQRPSVCCLRSYLQSSQSLLPPPTDSPGSVLLDSGYLYINQDRCSETPHHSRHFIKLCSQLHRGHDSVQTPDKFIPL